jgi:3,4-dehydroadipyl-CoA semialdehyde dehydrogenase
VTHRLTQLVSAVLPAGALQLLCGSASTLLDHCRIGDVVAFTGSSATARLLRGHRNVIEHAIRLNVEADSLNAAVLGPDVDLSSETGQLFLADVVRDMTQKSGQKCTAIRRIMVPIGRMDAVASAMAERLSTIVVGDPTREDVRMGPLATASQLADVRAGIARLAAATQEVLGGHGEVAPRGDGTANGYFIGPVLRRTNDGHACAVLHEHEVFGPVATIAGYDGSAGDAATMVALGEGGLVSAAYSDDRQWVQQFVGRAAAWNGRLFLGSAKMAAQSPGPGTVLPSLIHGGPGRAGGGEELGGLRGLGFYLQRCALQGDATVLKFLTGMNS